MGRPMYESQALMQLAYGTAELSLCNVSIWFNDSFESGLILHWRCSSSHKLIQVVLSRSKQIAGTFFNSFREQLTRAGVSQELFSPHLVVNSVVTSDLLQGPSS